MIFVHSMMAIAIAVMTTTIPLIYTPQIAKAYFEPFDTSTGTSTCLPLKDGYLSCALRAQSGTRTAD
ncbi:MAG: hypothetical protein WAM42_15520 [Candidatus Nitrosopolaris sp.]